MTPTTNEAPVSAFLLLLIAAVGLALIIGSAIQTRQALNIADAAATRAEASAQTLARMPPPTERCGRVAGVVTCLSRELARPGLWVPVVGEVER